MAPRLAVALTLAAAPAAAQRAGTAPVILQLPASTRAAGMGNVLVAGRGADVLLYNPSRLGLANGVSLSGQRYGSESTLGTLATSTTVGGWGVGVGAQVLDSWAGSDRLTTEPWPLTARGPVVATSRVVALGLAKEWRGLRWGGALKYADQRLAAAHASTVMLDVGASREVGRLLVGLAAQNLGTDLTDRSERATPPRRLTLGASIDAPPIGPYVDLHATAAVSVLHGAGVMAAGGAELSVTPLDGWTLALRAGARQVGGTSDERPLTVGAGLALDRLSLDYAYHAMRGPGSAHRLGVQLR